MAFLSWCAMKRSRSLKSDTYAPTIERPRTARMAEKTIFQRIIDKEIPAKIAYEDDRCLAFHDVAPQAPTHVLVIPKQPIASVATVADDDADLIAHLWLVIRDLAKELKLEGGY